MMRKDVKLGLAIGGVLLAVVVVYVLVGTGAGERNSVANNSPANSSQNSPANKSANNPAAVVTEDHSTPASAVANPADAGNNTIKPDADALAAAAKSNDHDANKDMWGPVLNEGHLMMTQTPTAPANDIPGGGTPPGASESRVNADSPSANGSGKANAADSMINPPSTQPDDSMHAPNDSGASASLPTNPGDASTTGRQRTHTVQKGETFASIAQMAYGSANYFPAIKRANPNIDERKLKPGMTIVLPAVSDVKPDAQPASAKIPGRASAEISLDSTTSYRVAAGDTLERIAIKLYGKREMKDKIYDLNKSTIGSDPNKLKLNQVLKLPSPPTNAK